ncbi:cytochrome oxidase assembly protein ShyY1 [Allocatelliglobosispora scoriae]|uniref:SURF1-like protein n=1 Tax=Allocatelliglobosispora scoriae TaxID=643052 RepID=A0A841BZR7_9ACTN|nr:SURF1 family protein [Allocatelliglobosispora scoriae]MBB5872151.1 cytochrome oxidase assembly protein ShyY1 [Allocatelliglobosispora scoriae]
MRTFLTFRWLGLLAAAIALAVGMVFLGVWQLSRYEVRDSINGRIDAGAAGATAALDEVLPAPTGPAGQAGPLPADEAQWRRIEVTGEYAQQHEVLVRNRTVGGRVGYEIVTPLVLSDGTAVLVDRGWIPPDPAGLTKPPVVPAPPSGRVTIIGRVHLTESGAQAPEQINGHPEVRRIGVTQIATLVPHPVWGAYLLAVDGTPGSTNATVGVQRENSWQNAAYVAQWWLFAALTLFGYFYLLRKEIIAARAPAAEPANEAERARVG